MKNPIREALKLLELDGWTYGTWYENHPSDDSYSRCVGQAIVDVMGVLPSAGTFARSLVDETARLLNLEAYPYCEPVQVILQAVEEAEPNRCYKSVTQWNDVQRSFDDIRPVLKRAAEMWDEQHS